MIINHIFTNESNFSIKPPIKIWYVIKWMKRIKIKSPLYEGIDIVSLNKISQWQKSKKKKKKKKKGRVMFSVRITRNTASKLL